MTIDEAIQKIELSVSAFIITSNFGADELNRYGEARDMAITALRDKQQREQLWHDANLIGSIPPPARKVER